MTRKSAAETIALIKAAETADDLREFQTDLRPSVVEARASRAAEIREDARIAEVAAVAEAIAEHTGDDPPAAVEVLESRYLRGFGHKTLRLTRGDVYSLGHHPELVKYLWLNQRDLVRVVA